MLGDKVFEKEVKDYLIAFNSIDDLKNKIIYYLANENSRNNISEHIYKFFKYNLNLVDIFPFDKIKNLLL